METDRTIVMHIIFNATGDNKSFNNGLIDNLHQSVEITCYPVIFGLTDYATGLSIPQQGFPTLSNRAAASSSGVRCLPVWAESGVIFVESHAVAILNPSSDAWTDVGGHTTINAEVY
jgi:hypothetical protein